MFKPFFLESHGALAHFAFNIQQLVLIFFAKSGMLVAGLTYSSAVVQGRFALLTPQRIVSASQHVVSSHEAASLVHPGVTPALFFKPFFWSCNLLSRVSFFARKP